MSAAADRRDWTEPGIEEVMPGIYRIPLPLPLQGLPAVNVYALEGPDGLVLIDSGWQSPEGRSALEQGVAHLGRTLADISTFLITHVHWDHYSMASLLRETLDCTVMLGGDEAESIFRYDIKGVPHATKASALEVAGASSIVDTLATRTPEPYEVDVTIGAPDRWLHDGETIELKASSITAIATPGHTKGHMVFHDAQRGVLFTGDHVLPLASPSVGGDLIPWSTCLESYLDSLERMKRLPPVVMLPAHGPVGPEFQDRVDELLHHHDIRLTEILTIVSNGSTGEVTAMDVARGIPWTKRKTALRDLDVVHQMTAVLEVDAHLNVLVERGNVEVDTDRSGVRRFRTRPAE